MKLKLLSFMTNLLLVGAMALPAFAQNTNTNANTNNSGGTIVTVAGNAEIKVDNDQAIVNFFIEEQDKDKAKAASRVNQKMKAGTELIKQLDGKAALSTRNYYTRAVYAEELQTSSNQVRKPQLVAWRVGQYLEVKTQNLKELPSLVAAVQKTLAMNGISFELSEEAIKKVEAQKIDLAYKNLMSRVDIIAKAMGRKSSNVQIEVLDFDGIEAMTQVRSYGGDMLMKSAPQGGNVEEPNFEPGVTVVNQRINAKVRIQ
jgi:predicted secreted protein